MTETLRFDGKVLGATVSRTADRWFIAIQVEVPDAQFHRPRTGDGVRVNIAPLHRAGLLAADVLAAKDIEKAIADRAQWRADERRWCRKGKLPRPGWWR